MLLMRKYFLLLTDLNAWRKHFLFFIEGVYFISIFLEHSKPLQLHCGTLKEGESIPEIGTKIPTQFEL